MTNHPEAQFLHQRNPQLQQSGVVELAVEQAEAHGEDIPNSPDARINTYLGKLAGHSLIADRPTDEQAAEQFDVRRSAQIEARVIKAEDVPESYFELQRRIAREQGHGDIDITDNMRFQMIESVQADQRKSLERWADYLSHPDANYPTWFRYYVVDGVTKLADFDKVKQVFDKRSRGTVANYPDLNREALAYVYDKISQSRVQGIAQAGNDKLQALLKGANFGKLYAHAVLEVTPASAEQKEITKGSWTKYDQIRGEYDPYYEQDDDGEYIDDSEIDNPTALKLAKSVQGHGTGWCTAGERTAAMQLSRGDFYVYYTEDEDGKSTVPRIAIRMAHGQVAEVRGIESGQNLEGIMADIAMEKLQDLPGGPEYQKKADDMKRLTDIDNRLKEDPNVALSVGDLRFLYELDRIIEGFGYDSDPRISDILESRNIASDFEKIFNTTDHNDIAGQLIDEYDMGYAVVNNLDKFTGLNTITAIRLIEIDEGGYYVARNLDKFTGLDQTIADRLIEAGWGIGVVRNLDNFTGLDHNDIANRLIDAKESVAVAENLDKFTGLDQTIADRLIELDLGHRVAENLDNFTGLDHNDIANRLLKKSAFNLVRNLDKFTGLDHNDIANRLINAGHERLVAEYLDKFIGLDQELIDKLKRLYS